MDHRLTRRAFGAGAAALLPTAALAADAPAPVFGTSPSVVSNPPRQWGADAPPMMYPDPDIITLDPSFRQLTLGLVAILFLFAAWKRHGGDSHYVAPGDFGTT